MPIRQGSLGRFRADGSRTWTTFWPGRVGVHLSRRSTSPTFTLERETPCAYDLKLFFRSRRRGGVRRNARCEPARDAAVGLGPAQQSVHKRKGIGHNAAHNCFEWGSNVSENHSAASLTFQSMTRRNAVSAAATASSPSASNSRLGVAWSVIGAVQRNRTDPLGSPSSV